MPFVVLKRDREKVWADVYGLFKTYQDAIDYVKTNRDDKYKYYVTEASDEEIDKSIMIKTKTNVFNAIEHIGSRQIHKKMK